MATMRKKGHFKIQGSSGIFTVPAKIVKEKSFPFKDGYKVMMELNGQKLTVFPLPRFEHINTFENRTAIYDNKLGEEINIYFSNETVWCEYDHATQCEHIDYALSLSEVLAPLREKGWKRKVE